MKRKKKTVSYDKLRIKMEKDQFKEDKKKFKENITNHIKDFKPYDYGYMMNVICDMVEYFYDFYSKKTLLHQDTDADYQYPDIINSIEKAYMLCNQWKQDAEGEVITDKNEDEILKELFEVFSKNIKLWWD